MNSRNTEKAEQLLQKTRDLIRAAEDRLPVPPSVRRAHPRTGEIVILSDALCHHPFFDSLNSRLGRLLMNDGFSVRLSAGNPQDWKRAEGILLTCGAEAHPDWIARLQEEKRCYVCLASGSSPGRNQVVWNLSGAWIRFFLEIRKRKIRHLIHAAAPKGRTVCPCRPHDALRAFFPEWEDSPEIHTVRSTGEDICRQEAGILLMEDPCIMPCCDAMPKVSWFQPERQTDFAFVPSGSVERELLSSLYRQLESGEPADPGGLLPVDLQTH